MKQIDYCEVVNEDQHTLCVDPPKWTWIPAKGLQAPPEPFHVCDRDKARLLEAGALETEFSALP